MNKYIFSCVYVLKFGDTKPTLPGNHEAFWEQMLSRIDTVTVSQNICQMFAFPGEVTFFKIKNKMFYIFKCIILLVINLTVTTPESLPMAVFLTLMSTIFSKVALLEAAFTG